MSNLDLWNKVCRPPVEALKAIGGGRLKGKTDINPQWRIKALTEQFGACGDGWYYEIVRLWTEPGANGEVMAFAHIHLFTKTQAAWGKPIPGIGGSMLVAKETNGMYSSDEAYKMATTDALSVAMKQLGVAADIYAGLWDGSKYKTPPPEIPQGKGVIKPADGVWEAMTEAQQSRLTDLGNVVKEYIEGGDMEGAFSMLEMADLDNEEKLALNTLFDSKQRSAMKRHKQISSMKGAI